MKERPEPQVGIPRLDRETLAHAIRGTGVAPLRTMLLRAFERLDDEQAEAVVRGIVPEDRLRPARPKGADLLLEVRAFATLSLAGDLYEGFNVNARNYREQSEGTRTWIRTFNDLGARVVAEADDTVVGEAAVALLDLLRRLDEGQDFIFFADEPGAFHVGADEAGLRRRAARVKASTSTGAAHAHGGQR